MPKIAWMILLLLPICVPAAGARAEGAAKDARKEEMRSLDDQVQEIKSDVLGIAKDLSLLEERLLYPSNTQVAVFVGLDSDQRFRLDAVQLQIDGELATHYIYSFKELEALQDGGVQRVYTGNVTTGSHDLTVSVNGKLQSGKEFSSSRTFTFTKGVEPKLLGLTLAGVAGEAGIRLGDW
jgi:hypothetical protein